MGDEFRLLEKSTTLLLDNISKNLSSHDRNIVIDQNQVCFTPKKNEKAALIIKKLFGKYRYGPYSLRVQSFLQGLATARAESNMKQTSGQEKDSELNDNLTQSKNNTQKMVGTMNIKDRVRNRFVFFE